MACSCGCTETIQRPQGKHLGEYCSGCDKWVRWVSQGWQSFIWPIGRTHKGENLRTILTKDRPYLEWAAGNLQGSLQKRAQEALNSEKSSGPTQSVSVKEKPKKPVQEPVGSKISGRSDDYYSSFDHYDAENPPW
jgi:hypothetical protein